LASHQSEFSDYIVFVDESGSPTLSPMDPNHPVFVLVFCVFNKQIYCDVIQPAVKRLKFEFFGHDMAGLHSSDIRKRRGDFSWMMEAEKRVAFLKRLDEVVNDAAVDVIATVIDKREPFVGNDHPRNYPYYMALRSCLNRLNLFLRDREQSGRLTHIVAESRGKREDKLLLHEFRLHRNQSIEVAQNFRSNWWSEQLPVELLFAEKKINSAGLQLADLFGHPIGRHAIDPTQSNHAFEIVERKIYGGISRLP
jgi:Protein of unknown function (DUF3800)